MVADADADADAETDVRSSRMMADTAATAATLLVLKARGERQRHFRIHGLIFLFGTDA